MGLIYLLAIVLIPLLVLYIFKVSAAPVFLSLCLGYVLFIFDGHNASRIIGSYLNNNYLSSLDIHLKATSVTINLFLLLTPAAITLISRIGSAKHLKKFLNLIPSLAVSLFSALLVVPLLPARQMDKIIKTSEWALITQNKALVVAVSGAVAILFFILSSKKAHSKAHTKE